MDDRFNVNLTDGDKLTIGLKSDELNIDLDSMIDTEELDISLQDEDNLNINLEDEASLNVNLLEGIPVGMDDYNALRNHPSINGEELIGNKTFEDLGRDDIKNARIKQIIDEQYDLIFGGN